MHHPTDRITHTMAFVICIADTLPASYVCTVYIGYAYGLCAWYVCMVCVHGMCVWYVCMVYMCLWYVYIFYVCIYSVYSTWP